MLQQTTVDVVARRYGAFLRWFPTLRALAAAPEKEVLAEWSGLGYYRRARMMHAAARQCVERFGAGLPSDFASLRSLPGVGDYTAGAIASIGFGLEHPAVDGNVARVWSRFDAVHEDPRALASRIAAWIPASDPGAFNEALIELGATVCRPVDPSCARCPIRAGCLARHRGEVARYPAPKIRAKTVAVTSARGVLKDGKGRILVARRPASASLLGGQDELPGRWLSPGETAEAALAGVFADLGFRDVRIGAPLARARHAITHHRIEAIAFPVSAVGTPSGRAGRFVPPPHLSGRSVTTETKKLAMSVASS
jgi:A/G-specific adenine glycosylase